MSMDFESSWQQNVSSGEAFPHSFFNHEAIVVHNHTITFYRNGRVRDRCAVFGAVLSWCSTADA